MEQIEEIEKVEKYLDMGVEMAMGYAPQLLLAIVTLIVGLWIVNRVTAGVGKGFERTGMEATLRKFVVSFLNVGLKVMVVISVAGMVGIETTSFIAVLGAAGLAVGLALQGSLANFAGGVLILFFRPFKVGDFIETGGNMGTVQEIGIFNTKMTTGDNKLIIIPNGSISNNAMTNFSAQPTRRVDITFGIGYDDDMKLAKELLLKLIEADERILKDPAPVIAVASLGESSVDILTRSWVNSADYWAVLWDLTENGKCTFDENGISIPFPQRDVHIYEESLKSRA